MKKLVLLLMLATMLSGCSWNTTHKIAPVNEKPKVCEAWALINYDSELDTAETVAEVKILNARRREYCGDYDDIKRY